MIPKQPVWLHCTQEMTRNRIRDGGGCTSSNLCGEVSVMREADGCILIGEACELNGLSRVRLACRYLCWRSKYCFITVIWGIGNGVYFYSREEAIWFDPNQISCNGVDTPIDW